MVAAGPRCNYDGRVGTVTSSIAPAMRYIRTLYRRLFVYHLLTTWRVSASQEEVADLFLDSASIPRWWRAFRQIEVWEPGARDGQGRKFTVVERSLLPYTVRFGCHVKRVRYPNSFTLKVRGDFYGRGAVQITQEGDVTVLRFDWFVRVKRPLFCCLSPLFRRAMVYNHRWSMRRGGRGLIQEMARRRIGLPVLQTQSVPQSASVPLTANCVCP